MRSIFLALLIVALAAWTFVSAALRWPDYYELIVLEVAPMRWLHSVLLAAAALFASVHAARAYMAGEQLSRAVTWLVLTALFAFLSLDERFQIHETARAVLAGSDWPVVSSLDDDIFKLILPVYVAAGLFLAPFVWRLLRDDRVVLFLFVAGGALAATAVGIDLVEPLSAPNEVIDPPMRVLEEILELAAFGSFFAGVVMHLFNYLPSKDQAE